MIESFYTSLTLQTQPMRHEGGPLSALPHTWTSPILQNSRQLLEIKAYATSQTTWWPDRRLYSILIQPAEIALWTIRADTSPLNHLTSHTWRGYVHSDRPHPAMGH